MRKLFCIVCDAPNLRRENLCRFCENKVNERPAPYFLRLEEGVPHYYLFRWSSKTDGFCRRLAYFFKGKDREVFREWAGMFPSQIAPIGSRKAFVPKRSSKGGLNHAEEFALSLKKLFGFRSVLEIGEGSGSQKRRTRKERVLELKRSVFKNRISRRLDCPWIFVDDVFVTGSTYKRVKSEFKNKPEMIVTLFYRPLIEGDDDDL